MSYIPEPTIPGNFDIQQMSPGDPILILGPDPQNRHIARMEEGTIEDAQLLAASRKMLAALITIARYGIKGIAPDGRWAFEHVRDAITSATEQ